MCGIAGIVRLHSSTTLEDVRGVERMMEAQVHRGPDGSGLYQDTKAVLGHRRLSIIDLSEAGKQPMSNEDRTVWVTYNGEIYNFRELREELVRQGHQFASKTDTEVLVHGYEQWGIDGLLSRLLGMYAFGLLDARASSHRLFLAKDPCGIKPLYYYYNKEKLLFASEVRAIMKSGMVPDEISMEAFAKFLQLGSVPAPYSSIKNVMALPAGHYLAIDEQTSLKRYWDISAHLARSLSRKEVPSAEMAITTTRALLEDSVTHHLISDVPLGVFLSGGIDSSSLVALASQRCEKPLSTVSIVFGEHDYSEAQYACAVAQRYHTDHHEVLLKSKEMFEELPRIFDAMDQPTIDGVNSYLVSKTAKQIGLTVVLSGTGGDEVFLGYDHFRKAYAWEAIWRSFGMLPSWTRKGLSKSAVHAGNLVGKMGAEKLAYLEVGSDSNLYLLFRGLFSPRQIQRLLGLSEKECEALASPPELPTAPDRSLLTSFNALEFTHYLQNQLLRDTDVMSMAHSMEIRVPFLARPLVEYVAGLPARFKFRSGVNKSLLVDALGEDLPSETWKRPKMGFTFPFSAWMKQQAKELQAASIEQKLIERKAIEKVWRDFKEDKLHWSRPWALLVASRVMQ